MIQLLTYSILKISVCCALQPMLSNVVLSRQEITCLFLGSAYSDMSEKESAVSDL